MPNDDICFYFYNDVDEVTRFCKENKDYICNEFDPVLTDEEFALTLDINNWRIKSVRYSYKSDILHKADTMEIDLDCYPFDDQLRGYITLDKDSKPISVIVQGE